MSTVYVIWESSRIVFFCAWYWNGTEPAGAD